MTVYILGHRGDGPTDWPSSTPQKLTENSLEAQQRCLTIGAHGIEVDLVLTADSTLVTLHPHAAGNIASGHGKSTPNEGILPDVAFRDLQETGRQHHITVPTLLNVLELADKRTQTNGDVLLDMDVKYLSCAVHAYHETMEFLAKPGTHLTKANFMFNSFYWDILYALREMDDELTLDANVSTGFLFGEDQVGSNYFVPPDTPLRADALDELRTLHRELSCAFDFTIHDLRPELLELCAELRTPIFAWSLPPRTTPDVVETSLQQLFDWSEKHHLPAYFKADHPEHALSYVQHLENTAAKTPATAITSHQLSTSAGQNPASTIQGV